LALPNLQLTKPTVQAVLWENDQTARARIHEHRDALFPDEAHRVEVLAETCTPEAFRETASRLRNQGRTVIWLCDLYWGASRYEDRSWIRLLNDLPETYGILFALVGGDSRFRGREKFNYEKLRGTQCLPSRRADDNVRSYGLFFTDAAKELLPQSGE
jgi:hypothetical protein